MIRKLDNKNIEISQQIYAVFQVSYIIEAKLLNAVNFPPLNRSVNDFLVSKTDFYGYWKNNVLAAVIEIKSDDHSTLIQSLVVDPKYFRRGIAGQLISFIFNLYKAKIYYVETGAANTPAILLYYKFGFKEVKQYKADHGIIKIRLKKTTSFATPS